MWSGRLDEIPAGWSLCDGQNGTPDLRDRFVMGVGAEEYLGSRGGSISHSHTLDNHTHRVDPPRAQTRWVRGAYAYAGPSQYRSTARIPTHDFDIQAFQSDPGTARAQATSSLPPYFKIAFIMKN